MISPGTPPAESPELGSARGAVREGLAALSNLSQLLKSVRVGPKAITEVLPDVQAACGPLQAAFERLISDTTGVDPALREALDRSSRPRLRQLSDALRTAAGGPLRASRRIDLESKVSLALRDLGVTWTLLDLVHESADGRSVTVDAEELVRESATLIDAAAPGVQKVPVTLIAPAEPLLVAVSPRAAMGLFALTTGLAATAAGSPVRITVTRSDDDSCILHFSKEAQPGSLAVVSPIPLGAASATAAVIAGAIGGRIERVGEDFVATVPCATTS